MSFALHPDILRDTVEVARLALCRVGLNHDANYPWLILSPMLPRLRDFHDVPAAQRRRLMDEIDHASRALQHVFKPHKVNVAALGNATPQLHIHVIGRYTDDLAWPKPVWGVAPAKAYTDAERNQRVAQLQQALSAMAV